MTSGPETNPPDGPGGSGTDVPDPSTWRTGDEPPTQRQQAYLETLAHEAGEELPEHMTKAEASEKIDELRDKTGRD
jgi:Protein of unknown function (DUF3072)